jgi:tetratricopeptide (TPR) repeat protein
LAARVAFIHHLTSRHAIALRWSRIALDEAKESQDPTALGSAYNCREVIVGAAGQRPEEPYGELALASYTAAGNLLGQGHGLTNLAIRSVADGDWDAAVSRFEEAAALFNRVGDTASEANTTYNRADVLQRQGRYDEAEPLLLAARRGALVTDDPELVALVDRELGKVRLGQGRLVEARTLLESARGALHDLGLQAEVVDAAVTLTHVSLIEGDVRQARATSAALLADAAAAGADELLARIHWLMGSALMQAADWGAAEAAFAAGRDAPALWDGGHVRALNLLGLVAVADHTGHDRNSEAAEAATCLHRLGAVGLPAPFDSLPLDSLPLDSLPLDSLPLDSMPSQP